MRSNRAYASLASLTLAGILAAAACSSGAKGGPVEGSADKHCGAKVQATGACVKGSGGTGGGATTGTGGGGGTGGTGGGSTGGAGGATSSSGAGSGGMDDDYGATMFNAEGDDDDCKYHVKWTSTDIRENTGVTFTVVATKKTDGSPLTGANPYIESFLSDVHPGMTADAKSTEDPPGTYAIGPVSFDAPGKWTVRFHFYGDCSDLTSDSPHGHAAFYVSVP